MKISLSPFDGLSLVGALTAFVSSFLSWISYGTDYGSAPGYSLWSSLSEQGVGQQLGSLLWLVLVGTVAGLWPLMKLRPAASRRVPEWPPVAAAVAAGGVLVHIAVSDSVVRGEIVGLIGLIAVAAGTGLPFLRGAASWTSSGIGSSRHVSYQGPMFDGSQTGPVAHRSAAAPTSTTSSHAQPTPPYWAAVLEPVDVFGLDGAPRGRALPDNWLLVVEHREGGAVIEDEGRRLVLLDRARLHPA